MYCVLATLWNGGTHVYGPFPNRNDAEAAQILLDLIRPPADFHEVIVLTGIVAG